MPTQKQIQELAGAIQEQAAAIEEGTVVGPLEAAAIRLMDNATTLRLWVGMASDLSRVS